MDMTKTAVDSDTRQQILQAALKCFAHSGYAATSVQHIVDDARVSKPALYYYFHDKAGLFQALVDEAHDERYRLMQEAAASGDELEDKLVEILTALFDYLTENRELMRIAFATAFAAPGELPEGLLYSEKCERNFEFIHSLMTEGLADGVLDKRFDSRELAYGFYGQLNAYLVSQLLMPDCHLNRQTAGRIVQLFLAGAAAKKRTV
jgi:AcrR family transcriptional regulator